MDNKIKVAIVGGGPAGLVTAYNLDPEVYDVTIYQTGFRVGGKGTSGYGGWQDHPGVQRIEEHGLHILFGFYDTVFSTMRRCYEDLARPSNHPLGTFEKAFRGRDFGTAMFRFRSRWVKRNVHFPANNLIAGGDEPLEDRHVKQIIADVAANLIGGTIWPSYHPDRSSILQRTVARALGAVGYVFLQVGIGFASATPNRALTVLRFWQNRVRGWLRWLFNLSRRLKLLWLSADFFVGLAIGLLEDDLFPDGPFDDLNDRDFRQWLKDQNVDAETLYSPLVSLIYHAAFSYEDGDPVKPSIAAGASLDLILRSMLRYRGHAYYQMNAGMGETVFVPLFQVLKARGVKFKFFHHLKALHLSADNQSIERMDMQVQVPLAAGRTDYEPLISVKGVDVFPSEPLYDQLSDETPRNYESGFEEFPHSQTLQLAVDSEFDEVVLATPIATLSNVAAELIAANRQWQQAVASGRSVQTLSLQVWFNEGHAQLGWKYPDLDDPHTLMSMYWKPMSTWTTMDQTLPREEWPPGLEPAAVSYFTGTQPGPTVAPAPGDDPEFVARESAKGRMLVEDYVSYFLAEDLLPKLEDPVAPPTPDWARLHAPNGVPDKQRLNYQYIQSNVEPSARVTLALPGSIHTRLKPDQTGFANLTVAGDWTDNGVYLACMEGAFASGELAAKAVDDKSS